MEINPKIFREYDIRGIVGKDYSEDFAEKLGQAFVSKCKKELNLDSPTIAVGYDCRVSTPAILEYLKDGITKAGANVLICGMGPTPQLYYSVFTQDVDAGIQITASHNPGEYNGFKMMIGKRTLSGPDILELRDLCQTTFRSSASLGVVNEKNVNKEYVEELIERSKQFVNKENKIKVVVDGGNGVGGLAGPAVLKGLGCEVIELYIEPDGTFPNHHPDPTELENLVDLQKEVIKNNADLGIAWDGDADRIGVVDEKGNPIMGDMLLTIYSRQLLKEVENPTIIADVKCSDLFFKDLAEKGANPVMAKTGHSLIKAKMKELNADLAGEMSGHMFFSHRYYGFDDAIHAAARLIEIVSNTEDKLSELIADLPKTFSTPELRLDCPDELKFRVVKESINLFDEYDVDTTDGIRISFDNGWGLVRASNTQPALVMRFEANSADEVKSYENIVKSNIKQTITSIGS